MSEQPYLAFLQAVDFFSAFSEEEIAVLADQVEIRSYKLGDGIIDTGEAADGLYIVEKGMVRLFSEQQGHETSVGLRKKGEVFGEISVLREVKHEHSVRASAKTTLLFIPRSAFDPLLDKNEDVKTFIARYVALNSAGGFVTRLFDLRGKVKQAELEEIITSVGIKRVKAGDIIIDQENTKDRRLYVVRQGAVSVVRKEEDNEFPLATLKQGEVFGERACIQQQEQIGTVIADVDTVLLIIPQEIVRFVQERNPKVRDVLEERIQFTDRELQRQRKLTENRRRSALFDLGSKPQMGEKLIKRFPLVHQAEEMDCGAACLAMICKNAGIPITLGKLREMANVTTQGATMDSLARVGESLGFTTRGVKCTYQSLLGFDLPFIAHWEGYHYIVVYGVSKNHVWVADPGPGFRKMTVEEFERGWNGTCLLFIPGTDMARDVIAKSPWVRFVRYLSPYKKILLHLFIATFVIQVLGVIPPVIIQNILDHVVVHQDFSLLHLLIAGLVVSHVFSQMTSVLRAFLSNYMVRNLDFFMMSQFLKHTLSLPMKFFATRKTGDIFARFQENQTIRAFLTQSTITTVLNLLMVFIYFSILFLYNVKMTLLLIGFVIPILLLTVLVTPKLKQYARDTFAASTDAESILMETLGGAETVKGMGIERAMRLKWERKFAKSLDIQYKAATFNVLVGAGSQILNAATTIAILWVGANLVLAQELTIGQLIAFNALSGSALAPLLGLVGLWNQIHVAGVAMERLGDILDMEPEEKPEDAASRVILPELHGDIRFDGVYFRYGGSETAYVLENVSFDIKAGEMVAVVGLSGSGKTTLAKIMVGFYKPTEGRVLVDGFDLNTVDKEYYRSQIGYVMQSNLLFSGTVAENIASGDENPDRQQVVAVAKMADAHGFISNLPLAYEQVVGERGMGLSGGQIQRLCIARALYRNPRLLIFDEATSALDTQSEGNILHNMQNILQGKTALVIAHRLSTIMQADKILVLYEGAIVEEGRHEELVARKGMYFQLVQKQLSGSE